jgi:ubiquinone/menaquinone biosynthesis C-methylase UbiE
MERAIREQFLTQYATIRHSEGRGSRDPEYYRALPFRDLTQKNTAQWNIRARTYCHFARVVLSPIEKAAKRPLRILDLGAGTGWLAWRLCNRGHTAIASDIFLDELDGLAATVNFPQRPASIAATFDELPFADASCDLVIFNSSLHYSADYTRTLTEARRVLTPDGALVILDSPIYTKAVHGERMREERQRLFERTHGFRSEALGSIEYLDEQTLSLLGRKLAIHWTRTQPWYGWRWAWRPWSARLHRKRPPSRFCILVGRFQR